MTAPDRTVRQEIVNDFDHCEFARLLGMRLHSVEGTVVTITMDSIDKSGPTAGIIHGGAIFSLADQAFGIAANMQGERRVALAVTIRYITPATGSLMAVAKRVSGGEIYSLYEVRVTEGDRLIAIFEGTAIKVPNPV